MACCPCHTHRVVFIYLKTAEASKPSTLPGTVVELLLGCGVPQLMPRVTPFEGFRATLKRPRLVCLLGWYHALPAPHKLSASSTPPAHSPLSRLLASIKPTQLTRHVSQGVSRLHFTLYHVCNNAPCTKHILCPLCCQQQPPTCHSAQQQRSDSACCTRVQIEPNDGKSIPRARGVRSSDREHRQTLLLGQHAAISSTQLHMCTPQSNTPFHITGGNSPAALKVSYPQTEPSLQTQALGLGWHSAPC